MYQTRAIETYYNHKNYRTRFHMLNREPRCYLRIYECTIICTLFAVAVVSMVWNYTTRILSTDLHDGFAGIQLAFHERNLQHLTKYEERAWHADLERIFNGTNTELVSRANVDEVQPKLLIMANDEVNTIGPVNDALTRNLKTEEEFNKDSYNNSENTMKDSKNVDNFDLTADRQFLTHMSIDIYQSRWEHSMAVQFLYGFSYISESVGILWGVMSFIFHTDFKKFWGVPQPWCIVLPSIIVFSVMTVLNLCYVVLAEIHLKLLCQELRKNLTKTDLISCGDAISLLRPVLVQRSESYDFYLKLYRFCYSTSFILWLSALMIIVSRCFLAVDFKIIDVMDTEFGHELQEEFRRSNSADADFVEIPLNSPIKTPNSEPSGHQCRRSEDDFQSAKSHTSEVETPLLEHNTPVNETTS